MNLRPFFICLILLSLLAASRGHAAEVLVVGDTALPPVREILTGMGGTLRSPVKTFLPRQVKGMLEGVVSEERAKVVVALGKEALIEALSLPPSIAVIYGLLVLPPQTSRPNTTGFYMATPAHEYADFLRTHFGEEEFPRIAVVGGRDQIDILARGESRVAAYSVRDTFELVSTVSQVNTSAILLLPDVSLFTPAAMEEVFYVSSRKKIPLLGVSEKNVHDGALLALVVDPMEVGRQIGERVAKALQGVNVGRTPPASPRKFDLFLNSGTARKMGIRLPAAVVRRAKRSYP